VQKPLPWIRYHTTRICSSLNVGQRQRPPLTLRRLVPRRPERPEAED